MCHFKFFHYKKIFENIVMIYWKERLYDDRIVEIFRYDGPYMIIFHFKYKFSQNLLDENFEAVAFDNFL